MKKIKYIFICLFLSFFSYSKNVLAASDCKSVVGAGVLGFIVDVFDMVKWIALALGIGLGMLDFFKAITGGKEDDLPKAAQKFLKRLIGIVILFILPVLLNWILGISGIEHGGTCVD